jgi:hypothetical protein
MEFKIQSPKLESWGTRKTENKSWTNSSARWRRASAVKLGPWGLKGGDPWERGRMGRLAFLRSPVAILSQMLELKLSFHLYEKVGQES